MARTPPQNKAKVKGVIVDANKVARAVPGMPLDKQLVKELIIKHRGNLTRVAIALGTARQVIRRLANVNPEIKETLDEARERTVDEVEDSFLDEALKGNTTAAIFFLKTRARDRGYDQDYRADIEGVTRTALSWALNKTREIVDASDPAQTIDLEPPTR